MIVVSFFCSVHVSVLTNTTVKNKYNFKRRKKVLTVIQEIYILVYTRAVAEEKSDQDLRAQSQPHKFQALNAFLELMIIHTYY